MSVAAKIRKQSFAELVLSFNGPCYVSVAKGNYKTFIFQIIPNGINWLNIRVA